MFTGIIQALGEITTITPHGDDITIEIHSADYDFRHHQNGDSIAVNGVCLTAIDIKPDRFCADVSVETLRATTFADYTPGTPVNLEPALTLTQPLGGHLVSGHVDGVATMLERRPAARSEALIFRVPPQLAKYIAPKGSVTLDGTSLTVNSVDGEIFSVNIVPHTQQRTIIGNYRSGQKVNIEVDLIARYIERLLCGGESVSDPQSQSSSLTVERLKQLGF